MGQATTSTPPTEAVRDALDAARDATDGRETIDNRERGCGHLDPNACYVRSDTAALSAPDGDIPRFVRFDDPVEYREHTGRGAIIPGYKPFPGDSFTKHYAADGRTASPPGDIDAHFDRLDRHGFDGDHYADITSCHATDILMSVGTTNYATPDEYIDEARDRGVNLKIPVSDRQAPPVIEPLRTRVFVIHPHGCGDGRPAIIGYAYLTRNVFTTGTQASADDPDVPGWAADFADTRDDFDIVDRGEPVGADEEIDDAQTTLEVSTITRQEATARVEANEGPDAARDPTDLVPSDDDGRDVEAASDADDTDTAEVPIEDLQYNTLKAKASSADLDVGSSPSKADLVAALHDIGIETATRVDGGSD